MMIHTSFYTLVLVILSSIITVADMCTNDSVVEDSKDGYKEVDSVLLRITKQQNNCTCHISLHKTVTNYTIYMSKYGELSSSAPVEPKCGLAVDVEYVETSDTSRPLKSIECTSGTSNRSITLEGNELTFRSRIINGSFTRGYCMQIHRNLAIYTCQMNRQQSSAGTDADYLQSNVQRNISLDGCESYCMETKKCVAVHYEYTYSVCFVYNKKTTRTSKDKSIYSQKDCVDSQKLQIKCYPPESTAQTSQGTTRDVTISTKTHTVTTSISDSTMTSFDTQSSVTTKDDTTKDKNSDLYVYIGAAAGGVLMILLIVCIIICIRKNSNQTSEKESKNASTKEFCSDNRDSDNDYGGLKDNILYVSSEPNEILEDGNYNTVDLEQTRKVNQDISFDGEYSTVDGICSNSSLSKSKPANKPKPKTNANSSLKRASDEETIHLSTMDNSNNEYAVVDKGRNSDTVKHTNPEHGNDTEYAVVNKVMKSGNNN